jgi:hypothetical protein
MQLDQQEDRHPVTVPVPSVMARGPGEVACGDRSSADPKRAATAARFGVAWLHA